MKNRSPDFYLVLLPKTDFLERRSYLFMDKAENKFAVK